MDNKVYIFSKTLNLGIATGTLLGEVQSDFNMSQVLDGTKDSMKVIIRSNRKEVVEPNTIFWHKDTNTWWIVAKDKVENSTCENGFLYVHNLQIDGAIELLNARDLTDCAFNQGDYNVKDVIFRLFELSNFEYYVEQIDTDINADLPLDHVKTFENYTLLSAIREYLDEYNYVPKLKFNVTGNEDDGYEIDSCDLVVLSKTGKNYLDSPLTMAFFDDVREVRELDKNSFGTCVISNADNVISTKAKTYPSVGACRLSSQEWEITTDNAILRLPSKVFKVNWLKIISNYHNVQMGLTIGGTSFLNDVNAILDKCNPSMPISVKLALEKLRDFIYEKGIEEGYQAEAEDFYENFSDKIVQLTDKICKANTTTIYEGNQVNAETGDIVKGKDVPYIAQIDISDGSYVWRDFIISSKETKDMLKYRNQSVYWERGSDKIEGFKGMTSVPIPNTMANISIKDFMSTDYQSNVTNIYSYGGLTGNIYFYMQLTFQGVDGITIKFKDAQFIVNYIPMSDMKVKVDNAQDKRDIQLYNQNGKLTDSIALSKLLNSYSKEISSSNITKYKHFYDYYDIPKVGQIVVDNNEEYVINNISYDFYQNDDGGYFIECEFTMSKNVAVKSMLVSPNTNIRDYGIPQNYNVKRKQVYRDYYELDYSFDSNANTDDPYYSTAKTFAFPNEDLNNNNFICQMDIKYASAINNSTHWYYQLETTTYIMNKCKYVVCDFKDNNIIGYGFMNMYSGFDITRLLDSNVSVNTPISYVDSKGRFQGIDLCFLTAEKLEQNILEFKDYYGYSSDNTPIYNASCFIDEYLYELANSNHDIKISESAYFKDALEVPVFEYAVQINDTTNVKVGSNFFNEHEGMNYLYGFVVGDNLNENNVWDSNDISFVGGEEWLDNGSIIQTAHVGGSQYQILVKNYSRVQKVVASGEVLVGNLQTWQVGKDYAFFRYAIDYVSEKVEKELLFIAKRVPESQIRQGTQELVININHYKLK